MSTHEGDILLYSTPDGAEINFTDGIIEMTTGFDSMVYLLLFGGNVLDDGTTATEKNEWWGNLLEPNNPERHIHSRFQNLLYGLPATPANLKRLEQAALLDLQVLTQLSICDKLSISTSISSKNRVNIEIDCKKDGKTLYQTEFSVNWEGQINGA